MVFMKLYLWISILNRLLLKDQNWSKNFEKEIDFFIKIYNIIF